MLAVQVIWGINYMNKWGNPAKIVLETWNWACLTLEMVADTVVFILWRYIWNICDGDRFWLLNRTNWQLAWWLVLRGMIYECASNLGRLQRKFVQVYEHLTCRILCVEQTHSSVNNAAASQIISSPRGRYKKPETEAQNTVSIRHHRQAFTLSNGTASTQNLPYITNSFDIVRYLNKTIIFTILPSVKWAEFDLLALLSLKSSFCQWFYCAIDLHWL